MVLNGWRSKVSNDAAFLPYKQRELSVQDGLYCGDIVFLYPPVGREAVMQTLRDAHPGITRFKGLASSFVWWSGIDKDLECKVKSCQRCQENGPFRSLGVASKAVVSTACRLCRSFYGDNVSGSCGCTL